jgi:hypothetical protein
MTKQVLKEVIFLMLLFAILTRIFSCNTKPIPKKTIPNPQFQKYANTPPDSTTRILFIHHSCGGNWAADCGTYQEIPNVVGGSNIYLAHENGGGLRRALLAIKTLAGNSVYELHEAARKSFLGAKTDVCHWYKKFTNYFDRNDSTLVDMLNVDMQDKIYDGQIQNEIIMFKSCYPNSDLEAGGPTLNPLTDTEKTIGNYKTVYNALLTDVMRPERQGDNRVLFIVVTAPPRSRRECNQSQAAVARKFNNWLRSEWLYDTDTNVAVFDYFNLNTGGIGNDLDGSWEQGCVNYSAYVTGRDSHPNSEAQQLATSEFLRFINLAYNRWKGRMIK